MRTPSSTPDPVRTPAPGQDAARAAAGSRRSGRAAHARSAPFALLFVCQGNVARSPAAQLLAARRLAAASDAGAGIETASAGTGALVGAGIAPEIGTELAERGVDASGHRAQQLGAGLLRAADLVLVMEAEHRRWILEEWPGAVRSVFLLGTAARVLGAQRSSPATPVDAGTLPPHGAGDPTTGLPGEPASPADPLALLRAPGVRVLPEDGIADPYRRGREAARRAVARIDQCLELVLPELVSRPRSERG